MSRRSFPPNFMTTHLEAPRQHRRDLLIAVVIGAAVLAATLNLKRLGILNPPHGRLVEQVFGKPAPTSIQLIHSSTRSHWSGTKYVWMHFRLSPADLEVLLKSGLYAADGYPSTNFSAYEPPQWWNTDSMGPGKRVYGREIAPQFGRHRSTIDLAVITTRDEIFLLMRNWYEP